jgi:hypothetical protein
MVFREQLQTITVAPVSAGKQQLQHQRLQEAAIEVGGYNSSCQKNNSAVQMFSSEQLL